MIRNTLKDAGFAVLEAEDGTQALRILLTENAPEPSVIVLDLRLPTMSGPEPLKVLRSYHRFSRIPVILTSAGPRYIDGRNEAGWLPKPFDAERLIALVSERCSVPRCSDDSGLGQSS